MAYATVNDVQARMTRQMSEAEQSVCSNLLDDAAVIIDAYNHAVDMSVKNLVSVRMVIRVLLLKALKRLSIVRKWICALQLVLR